MATEYFHGGGKERLAAASALHGETFKSDPVMNYFTQNLSTERRIEYIPQMISTFMWAAAESGSTIFDEAWTKPRTSETEAPQCSAVWLPPGKEVATFRTIVSVPFIKCAWKVGLSGVKRILGTFQAESDKAKKMGLVWPDSGEKVKEYYYLFFISTDPAARGKGLASVLIRNFQDRARAERRPIWLESTTEGSHRLYQRLGFKDVRSWTLGTGKTDESGSLCKGGKGVTTWAMIWWPDSKSG